MTDQIFLSILAAAARVNLSRSRMYEILATGEVRSVKCGRSRLVDSASLTNWAASLPTVALKQAPAKESPCR